jgi:paraquat-inducible protein A
MLLSAAAFYVPANLLPVMHTRTFFSEDDDTIMSGVLSLIQEGSWPLALLVFVASIVVPLLKIIAMGWLLISVARQSPGSALQKSRLFRLVEFIGRWSMLDVFAIALLVSLVQIRSLATIKVGLGALAFGAVVVLTMLAAQSFDERLLWDCHSDG